MENNTALEIKKIGDCIIRLFGRPPVMLSKDLAELYQVTPDQITRAVRRNPDRFPEDFAFRLTPGEYSKIKSGQFDRTDEIRAFGESNTPLAFTREGANMLSTVLRSKVAAERSVQIMRAFSAMEEQCLKTRMDKLEEQVNKLKKSPVLLPVKSNTNKGVRSLENRLGKFLNGREISGWSDIKNNFHHRYHLNPEEEKKLKGETERALINLGWRV